MTKKSDPIHKVPLAHPRTILVNGKPREITERWRFVIDVGQKPDGRRDQRTFTFDSLREAKAERAKIIAARSNGTYVTPTKVTVAEVIDTWIEGKRNLKAGTLRTYTDSLRHARDRIGHLAIQQVTKADVDKVVNEMLTSGRRVGNVKSKKLSPRTVNAMLVTLTAVFEDAVMQGIIGRNVVKLVEKPRQGHTEMQTWTADQASAFLEHVTDDRLSAGWQMSLYGLRRSEVLGLRWSDIDLVAKTLTVRWVRKSVAGVIVEEDPKTERSKRTLSLDDDLVAALTALQLRQREEREEAGEAYARPCRLADANTGDVCTGDHVIVDELGRPCRPEWYGDRFEALSKAAKLPVIRLHDARHTCGTVMHLRGVKTAIISAWLGHASASFTMRTYVHSQDEELADAAQTLRAAFKPSQKATVREP